MGRRNSLASFILPLAVLGSVQAASAQQSYTHWTIEALTAQSKAVFRGVITNILELAADSKPGQPPMVNLMLTVTVKERLKGRTDRTMTLMRDVPETDKRYDQWMKQNTPLIWFTFDEAEPRAFPGAEIGPGLGLQPGYSWTTLHVDEPLSGELALDPHAGQPTFSADLRLLKTGAEKLDAIKKFVKDQPDRVPVFPVPLPGSLAAEIGYQDVNRLVLPASLDVEAKALKMISTPDALLPKDATPADKTALRTAGIVALKDFKSDQNVALLKSLLNDPSKGPYNANGTPTRSFYWVRANAYQVLAGWGVHVAKPTL